MKLRILKNDGDDKKSSPQITNQTRKDWNDYISFLHSKGLAGNPVLDHSDYGNKVLSDYIKANPNTSLRPELVAPIQKDFTNYRQYAIDQIKQGKGAFANGVNENNFMTNLSKTDGWSGSETTKHFFPKEYLDFLDQQNNIHSIQDKGFATTK